MTAGVGSRLFSDGVRGVVLRHMYDLAMMAHIVQEHCWPLVHLRGHPLVACGTWRIKLLFLKSSSSRKGTAFYRYQQQQCPGMPPVSAYTYQAVSLQTFKTCLASTTNTYDAQNSLVRHGMVPRHLPGG